MAGQQNGSGALRVPLVDDNQNRGQGIDAELSAECRGVLAARHADDHDRVAANDANLASGSWWSRPPVEF